MLIDVRRGQVEIGETIRSISRQNEITRRSVYLLTSGWRKLLGYCAHIRSGNQNI